MSQEPPLLKYLISLKLSHKSASDPIEGFVAVGISEDSAERKTLLYYVHTNAVGVDPE